MSKYKIEPQSPGSKNYDVLEINYTPGENLNSVEFERCLFEKTKVFSGLMGDCYAYIKAKENGYL